MTKYQFKCKKCKKIEMFSCDLKNIKAFSPICPNCGEYMIRDFRSSLVVPESLKAENRDSVDWANSRLKNTPTGRNILL